MLVRIAFCHSRFSFTIIDFHFSKIGSPGEREERLVELTRRFTDMMEGKVRLMVMVVMMVVMMVMMVMVTQFNYIAGRHMGKDGHRGRIK